MKKKILFDISVLGDGHIFPLARTGVFRYIENLLIHLLKDDRIEIKLVSSKGNFLFCLRYLYNTRICEISQFFYPKTFIIKLFTRLFGRKIKFTQFIWKILSEVFIRLTGGLITGWRYITNIADSFDVYHSGFHKIPIDLNKKPITKILSVMDLIPRKYPEYFSGTQIEKLFLNILSDYTTDTKFICISDNTRQDLLAFLNDVPQNNAYVTHLAASNLFYPVQDIEIINKVKKKYNIQLNCKYFLSLCTIEPRKNIKTVIKAFAEFKTENNLSDLKLVLVGNKGWDNEFFTNLTKHDDIANDIIITGYIADEDLAGIYSGASAFLYLSYYEGFGLPPLEAMQCGIPVIASNSSSLPEVVGDAGILVHPDNIDEIKLNMKKILMDEEFASTLKSKSLEKAKTFSWKKCVDETINVYFQKYS